MDLETLVSQLSQAAIRQAQHQAAKQKASIELQQLVVSGKDVARDLGVEAKSFFGSRAEDLVQFRVLPLRQGRKAKSVGAPEFPPPSDGSTPEAPTPAPVSGTQPITTG